MIITPPSANVKRNFWERLIFFRRSPESVGETEVGLALVHNLLDAVRFNHLTQKSGNALIGEVAQTVHVLDEFGHGIQLVRIRGQLGKDNVLVAVVGNLIHGRLLVTGVLAGQQVDFVVDKLNHSRVSLNLGQFEQSLETVALGELLNSRSRHSINSFLWR
nr:MAG TPA: hypothetical protein [Caudoviricetes sp.]